LAKVVLEVLDDFLAYQLLGLKHPLINGIEVNQEHVDIEGRVE
jgi:hypothetical protein